MAFVCPRYGATPPLIMGILNVTPDSFSDGGNFTAEDQIAAQVGKMVEEGADIIDVGGESTRPFAIPVSLSEELNRILPAIKTIRRRYAIPISIDTTKAEVARQALDCGADIINDISGLRFDPLMVQVVRQSHAPIVMMHMQGTPGTMQTDPIYENVVTEIVTFLQGRIEWALRQGIERRQIIVDPGIGFGKSLAHNLIILNELESFQVLECPLLIGHSRKSFIGKIVNREAQDRDLATAVVSAYCMMKKATILRVHDVDKTRQALSLVDAIISQA